MRITPEISGVSIVLVGNFNPAIFTPAWFALNKLIPDEFAESAELGVAHAQMTSFHVDWLSIEARPDLFLASTHQDPHIRVCDLVSSTFGEHLSHTPVRAAGINRDVHFQVESIETRDRIGKTLVPTEPWGKWRENLDLDGENGGMTSVTVSQTNPSDRAQGGQINVKVEPSNRIGEGRYGIYVRVNDHFTIVGHEDNGCVELTKILATNYEESIKRSDKIVDHLMSLA